MRARCREAPWIKKGAEAMLRCRNSTNCQESWFKRERMRTLDSFHRHSPIRISTHSVAILGLPKNWKICLRIGTILLELRMQADLVMLRETSHCLEVTKPSLRCPISQVAPWKWRRVKPLLMQRVKACRTLQAKKVCSNSKRLLMSTSHATS